MQGFVTAGGIGVLSKPANGQTVRDGAADSEAYLFPGDDALGSVTVDRGHDHPLVGRQGLVPRCPWRGPGSRRKKCGSSQAEAGLFQELAAGILRHIFGCVFISLMKQGRLNKAGSSNLGMRRGGRSQENFNERHEAPGELFSQSHDVKSCGSARFRQSPAETSRALSL